MIKLFVSQPMNGLSDAEIMDARRRAHCIAIEKICNKAGLERIDNIELIDSFFQDAPVDAKPLWYLGESLKKLSEADVAIFAKGCRATHEEFFNEVKRSWESEGTAT